MKKIINAAAGTIEFTFEGLEPVVFNPASMSAVNQKYAVLHGMAARIGDNAAIQKSEENGFRVTEGMRREAVMELVEHYLGGSEDWSPKARATKAKVLNPAILQIAERLGCTYAEAEAKAADRWLAELDAMGKGE